MDRQLKATLSQVAGFYDQRKRGEVGALGLKRSSDLMTLLACMERLLQEGILNPRASLFLDLGCADGRINVLLSYLVKISVGIELDEWSLDEYGPLRHELETVLKEKGFLPPPKNTFLFQGDSMDEQVHQVMARETGARFEDFDLFYTYLVMDHEFAALIANRAKQGAVFMVYGLYHVLPKYPGLRLLDHISPLEGILAVYEKD